MYDSRIVEVLSLLRRTAPFLLFRFLIYVGLTLAYVIGYGVGIIGNNPEGFGLCGELTGFGLVGAALYMLREYLLHLVKARLAGGCAALLLFAPLQGLAAERPSWDYLSLGLVLTGDIEQGAFSKDLKGYRLEAVKSPGGVPFFRAVANAYHVDDSGLDIDLSTHQFGVGARYHVPAGPVPVDLWASLNYERVDIAGMLATGPGLDLGARARLTPELDMGLIVKVYGDLEVHNIDFDYTGYELNAAYAVLPRASVLLSWSNSKLEPDVGGEFEYKNIVSLGVRMDF